MLLTQPPSPPSSAKSGANDAINTSDWADPNWDSGSLETANTPPDTASQDSWADDMAAHKTAKDAESKAQNDKTKSTETHEQASIMNHTRNSSYRAHNTQKSSTFQSTVATSSVQDRPIVSSDTPATACATTPPISKQSIIPSDKPGEASHSEAKRSRGKTWGKKKPSGPKNSTSVDQAHYQPPIIQTQRDHDHVPAGQVNMRRALSYVEWDADETLSSRIESDSSVLPEDDVKTPPAMRILTGDKRDFVEQWVQDECDRAGRPRDLNPRSVPWFRPKDGNKNVVDIIAPEEWADYSPFGDRRICRDDFYRQYLMGKPFAIERGDTDRKPWWEKYVAPPLWVAAPVPRACPLDPQDEMYVFGKSIETTADFKIKKGIADGSIVPEHDFEMGPEKTTFEKGYSVRANLNQNRNTYRKQPVKAEYQGEANMTIRQAFEFDAPLINVVYNHFVENTWFVTDRHKVSDQDMLARMKKVEEAGWPWLVACEAKSARSKGRRKGAASDSNAPAKVMGYACIEDLSGPGSVDRLSGKIHIWVLPECQFSTVGTSLLDRLFWLVLKEYELVNPHVAYVTTTGPFAQKFGCKREPHVLLAELQYAPRGQDEKRANIVSGFLQKRGFERYGEQREVAARKNLTLNRRLFQRICLENSDGCYSEYTYRDTKSIKDGNPAYIPPEDLTPEAIERRFIEEEAAAEALIHRPLPQDYSSLKVVRGRPGRR